MAFKSIEIRKEYMRKYYQKIRDYAIERLGGKCYKCGKKHDLEFDHLDRTSKKFSIGKLMNYSQFEFEKELEKCQLLCSDCHDKKSVKEGSFIGGLNKKLNEKDLFDIWGMLKEGKSQRFIAKKFGVSHITIGNIKRNKFYIGSSPVGRGAGLENQ